ncbi:MAG: Cof-type HAD-IIB family hydrolase [Clostridium sp.]|nr:Cof-type HAD-IIB family hydrolase [Clostridium sp.]
MTLYISDLDGTLLNNSAQISCKSAKLLNEAIKNNINFTIATARTPATIVPILKDINIKLPVIVMNGSSIYNVKTNEYLHTQSINKAIIPKLQQLIYDEDLNPFIYTLKDNHLYVYHNELNLPHQIKFYNERKNNPLKTFIKEPLPENVDVLYFTIIDSKEKISNLYSKLLDIPEISVVMYSDIYNETIFNLEIYDCNTSKSNAINYLKNYFHFDKLITFGDNINDIPMFKISDECYAVKNAANELKELATDIIDLNTSDSVAKYIYNQYINK